MVPHEAHHDLLLNDDRMSLSDFGEGMGNYGFQHKRRHDNTDSTTFFCDLDIKPEVDTGTVTDEWFSFKKLWKYAGPGLLMSIAYLDPGNLESDLQSGAVAGYSLLWLLFWAHVIGLIFQLLSARLGIITGSHLAQLIRQSYSTRMSIVLWAFAQVAIIGADIMEIVGTAVALNILFGLPLWAGVIMTAMDTLTFMMIQRYGMRKIEAFFMVLITVMTVCFWVELIQSKPDVKEIMKGMVIPKIPLHTELQAVGMLGAIVMPHNMFLHSALVKSRDLGPDPSVRKLKEANFYFGIESALALLLSFFVNLAIVVVFAKVFYNPGQAGNIVIPGLGQAEAVLSKTLGPAAKYLWAGGLLAAGQSSTMTGTLAGQYVCEGFFGMIFKKEWHRMAATRGISLVPGILVAVFAVDHFDTMGEMLNVLQSICLPTVLIPIMKLSWSPDVVPAEFRLSTPVHIICITLVCVVIGFDVFLFVRHINSLTSFILIGLFSTAWILFLIWLTWLPVDYTPEKKVVAGEWSRLPGEENEQEVEENQIGDIHRQTHIPLEDVRPVVRI